jgi:hypothetical protein
MKDAKNTDTTNTKNTDQEKAPQGLGATGFTLPDADALSFVVRAPRFVSHCGEWRRNRPSGGVGVGVGGDDKAPALRLARALSASEKGEGKAPPLPTAERAPDSLIDGDSVGVSVPLSELGITDVGKARANLVPLLVALLDSARVGGCDLVKAEADRAKAEAERIAKAQASVPPTLKSALETVKRGPSAAGYQARATLFVDALGTGAAPALTMARQFVEHDGDVSELVEVFTGASLPKDTPAPVVSGIADVLRALQAGIVEPTPKGESSKAQAKATSK